MPAPLQNFEIVLQLTLAGSPVTSLNDGDFSAGVVSLQKVEEAGVSPAPVPLTGGVEFTVEELQVPSGIGQYVLKMNGALIPTEGIYSLVITKPGTFDPLDGVVDVRGPTDLDELLALAGKNVVGIPSGYDATTGNLTGITLFFFASKEDAEEYITEYFDPVLGGGVGLVTPATAAKVTDFLEEATIYNSVNGRIEGFIRKKD